ncbi:cupredoxin domain-containing protein (plasmid) [Azospirillum sp. TSA2s]|nr:cupredoxin domain-containing protein [Azospirillum sp. TSA2s]
MPARVKKVVIKTAASRWSWRLSGAVLTLAGAVSGLPGQAHAADPVFRIVFEDGKMTPLRIEVPADTRIELQLVNAGKTPAEFESLPLRKEKVIAPGVTTDMVIKGLDPGEYPFFDDFHPDAPPAVLIAK